MKEISGHDWTLKLVKQEKVLAGRNPRNAARAKMPITPFKDDPLIREALEIFKGEIKILTIDRQFMNLNKLMKQAQKMQEQMAKTQAELEEKTVEVQRRRRQSKGGSKRRRRRHLDQNR